MAAMCDILLNVPETETARVQELHLPLYHTLCRILEEELYG
jgi:D-sedoheptulose 7-phosphate isomerase